MAVKSDKEFHGNFLFCGENLLRLVTIAMKFFCCLGLQILWIVAKNMFTHLVTLIALRLQNYSRWTGVPHEFSAGYYFLYILFQSIYSSSTAFKRGCGHKSLHLSILRLYWDKKSLHLVSNTGFQNNCFYFFCRPFRFKI